MKINGRPQSGQCSEDDINKVLTALSKNSLCQVLYFYDCELFLRDEHIKVLGEYIVSHSQIWCIFIENASLVSANCWSWFIKNLSNSNITHGYLCSSVQTSENSALSSDLVIKAKEALRSNRKKHLLHCSPLNINVIKQCDSLWWNPIKGYLYHVYRMESANILSELVNRKQGQLSPAPATRSQQKAGACFLLNDALHPMCD